MDKASTLGIRFSLGIPTKCVIERAKQRIAVNKCGQRARRRDRESSASREKYYVREDTKRAKRRRSAEKSRSNFKSSEIRRIVFRNELVRSLSVKNRINSSKSLSFTWIKLDRRYVDETLRNI